MDDPGQERSRLSLVNPAGTGQHPALVTEPEDELPVLMLVLPAGLEKAKEDRKSVGHAEVADLFGDLHLQWPDVVPVTRWRPSSHEAPGGPCDIYGGLAVVLPPPGQPYRPVPGSTQAIAQPGPDSDTDELARLAPEYPSHRIWRETTLDRTRYIARSNTPDASPHTLVTASLAELRAELGAGADSGGAGPPSSARAGTRGRDRYPGSEARS
jgi:hypothetical protein